MSPKCLRNVSKMSLKCLQNACKCLQNVSKMFPKCLQRRADFTDTGSYSTKVNVLLLLPTTVWLFLLFSSSCHSITQKNAHLFPWTYRQELRDNLIDRKVLSSISQNPPPPICQKNIYEMIYIYSKRLKNLENILIIYCGKQN